MFLDGKYGAGGKSKRRLDLKTSSMCHYWIEGCLTNSNTRFRKFFRVSRARFDQMYEAAGDRGEFRLNPAEPLFSRAYPEPPTGNNGAQLHKGSPLCLRMGAVMRHLATGEPFSSLQTSFNISKPVLVKFFPKFLQWFLRQYYSTYVGGMSGVGFDTLVEIEQSERLFHKLVLPGFITCMDAVHFAYDLAPFAARHLFIGKEGYPTVGTNMHYNAIGWVKDVGSIFPTPGPTMTRLLCDSMPSPKLCAKTLSLHSANGILLCPAPLGLLPRFRAV
jgi:hypothetical protein